MIRAFRGCAEVAQISLSARPGMLTVTKGGAAVQAAGQIRAEKH